MASEVLAGFNGSRRYHGCISNLLTWPKAPSLTLALLSYLLVKGMVAGRPELSIRIIVFSPDGENRSQEPPLLLIKLVNTPILPPFGAFTNEGQTMRRLCFSALYRKAAIVEVHVHQALHNFDNWKSTSKALGTMEVSKPNTLLGEEE